MQNNLYRIVELPDGRLAYEVVTPRTTWREHVNYFVAAVGVASGLYCVALAFVWHI